MRMKYSIFIKVFLMLFSVLLLTCFFSQAVAQKKSKPTRDNSIVKELSAEKVGRDASELLADINATVEKIQYYLQTMKQASEEGRLVLELQIASLQQHTMEDVHQLTDTLLEMEEKKKQPELRNQVESVILRVTSQ